MLFLELTYIDQATKTILHQNVFPVQLSVISFLSLLKSLFKTAKLLHTKGYTIDVHLRTFEPPEETAKRREREKQCFEENLIKLRYKPVTIQVLRYFEEGENQTWIAATMGKYNGEISDCKKSAIAKANKMFPRLKKELITIQDLIAFLREEH